MNRVRILVVVLLSLFAGAAYAGAWGVSSLSNDDALDFLQLLEDEPSQGLVYGTLQSIASTKGYVEAPDGAYGIAAAEMVAAMLGNPSPELFEPISGWASRQGRPPRKYVELALDALTVVENTDVSELAQLFAEDAELFAEWRASVNELRSRLQ
ncbi:MAG: DUF4259 domain-containing protein [Pseudomonadota bacterium]